MQLEHYELSIRGDEFTVCLQQLDALDDSSKGSVELRVVDGKLLIERQINKKNYCYRVKSKWALAISAHVKMVKFLSPL
jgi:hypothetical protein